jgi:hypothetical protein
MINNNIRQKDKWLIKAYYIWGIIKRLAINNQNNKITKKMSQVRLNYKITLKIKVFYLKKFIIKIIK